MRGSLVEGILPCGRAFRVAEELGLEPMRVGEEANRLDIRISLCQLGLFGHPTDNPKGRIVELLTEVPGPLEEGLRAAAPGDRLRCAEAWALADGSGVSRLTVANAAEALGIHIVSCQLGCF
jgi:hypothetical protein